MDNFALLNEPRRPWIDPDLLKASFLRMAAQFHPDKLQSQGATESRPTETKIAAANERYAALNAAYRCLLEPKDRLRHLLELERGAPPTDAHGIPPDMTDLLMEIGLTCREADTFLAAKSKTTSPLLKAQMFEAGMNWTNRLNELRQKIELRRGELLALLKKMNDAWNTAPPPGSAGRAAALPLDRLEQVYRLFSYVARGSEQVRERLAQLSF
jgi:hypothetical protein